MNRRQRRALMKRFPGYKKLFKEAAAATMKDFEEKLQKHWEKQEEEKTEKDGGETKRTEMEKPNVENKKYTYS